MITHQSTDHSGIRLEFTLEHLFITCSLMVYVYLPVMFILSNMASLDIVMGFFAGQIILFLLLMIYGMILSQFAHRAPSRATRIKALV